MAIVRLRNLGVAGINSDLPKESLPPNTWTSCRNMVFKDSTPSKALGEEGEAFGAPLPITPYGVFPAQGPSDYTWVMMGLNAVYAFYNGTLIDITRVDGASAVVPYTAQPSNIWTGGWMNGVTFLNNGADVPQYVEVIGGSSKLADLTNWDPLWKTRVLRTFKNYVFALDVVKSGVRYPTLFKWSHPALPGSVPPSWDETDPAYLAGEFPISSTPGRLVDGLSMKNSFIIYKTDGIISVRETGDNDIFRFDPISTKFGIPAIGCVAEFKPGMHAFLSQTADLMLNNGQSIYSISTGRVRRRIDQLINSARIDRSFVTADVRNTEIWFCLPISSSDWPNYAITWNWETNTFGEKYFPSTSQMAEGKYNITTAPGDWDSQTGTWAKAQNTWDGATANLVSNRILGASPESVDIILHAQGYASLGQDRGSAIERLSLAIAGEDAEGNVTVDPNKVKLITRVFPLISAPFGGIFKIRVGAQDSPSGRITWQGPYDFDPETQEYLEFFLEGKYISYRVENTGSAPWRLNGFDFDIALNGEFF